MRPRGEYRSSPVTRYVGQCGKQSPQPTHVTRSSSANPKAVPGVVTHPTVPFTTTYNADMNFDPVSVFDEMSARLGALAEADPEQKVEACPGWVSNDVVRHLGSVYAMVSAIMAAESTDFVKPGPEAEPPSSGLPSWFHERRRVLGDLLARTDPELPLWTWGADASANFYRRRMVHETCIHLGDIERSSGTEPNVTRDISLDGIDEFFETVLPFGLKRRAAAPPAKSLHLHSTDGPGEWMIRTTDGIIAMTHEHAKGDVAWRGSATHLYFAVWGRWSAPIEELGDAEGSREWRSIAP